MQVTSFALTHPGVRSDKNDDSFLADDARRLYIVSDGLGRRPGAQLASSLVVKTISEALAARNGPSAANQLMDAAHRATLALKDRAAAEPHVKDMAATLTLLTFDDEGYAILQIGDSRAYVLRGPTLRQITRDHSLAYEQYLAGGITKDEVRAHPNQKLLTRAINADQGHALPDTYSGKVASDDLFLVCSDGLTKELSDAEIGEYLKVSKDPEPLCRTLVEAAVARGGRDNITVIVAKVT